VQVREKVLIATQRRKYKRKKRLVFAHAVQLLRKQGWYAKGKYQWSETTDKELRALLNKYADDTPYLIREDVAKLIINDLSKEPLRRDPIDPGQSYTNEEVNLLIDLSDTLYYLMRS
jgi:hypothetical protein